MIVFQLSILIYKKGDLNRHIEIGHEGKKPNLILVIQLFFKKEAWIIRHNESIHEGKKPYKCNICDTDFIRKEWYIKDLSKGTIASTQK